MSFERPAWLLLALVGVPLLALAYGILERRRTGREIAYSNLPFLLRASGAGAGPARVLRAGWILGALLLALAAAGPRVVAWLPAKDGAAFICIDTSGSMASTDVSPTRAQAAVAAARAFVAAAPAGTKIGIIAFASSAGIVAPLTSDPRRLRAALAALPPPNGATAIGSALEEAARALPVRGHRAVVLITDGVNNRGADPLAIARYLGAHHIPVYTVGIGTNHGAVIPGTSQPATIDSHALRAYARESGGRYARATDAVQLRAALMRLGKTTSLEKKSVDASLVAALAAGVLMIATFFAGFAAGRLP